MHFCDFSFSSDLKWIHFSHFSLLFHSPYVPRIGLLYTNLYIRISMFIFVHYVCRNFTHQLSGAWCIDPNEADWTDKEYIYIYRIGEREKCRYNNSQ